MTKKHLKEYFNKSQCDFEPGEKSFEERMKLVASITDNLASLWDEDLSVETIPETNKKSVGDTLDPEKSKAGKINLCSKALHPQFSYPLVQVSEMSIEKGYEPLNWLQPGHKVTMTYLIGAAQRHLDKVKLGIDINTEEKKLDGTDVSLLNQPYHAAQVAYNMLMLVRQILDGVAIDDRLFKNGELK